MHSVSPSSQHGPLPSTPGEQGSAGIFHEVGGGVYGFHRFGDRGRAQVQFFLRRDRRVGAGPGTARDGGGASRSAFHVCVGTASGRSPRNNDSDGTQWI